MTSFSQISKNTELSIDEQLVARQVLVTEFSGVSGDELKELFEPPQGLEGIAKKNCENVIGQVAIPVGVVGPLKLMMLEHAFNQDSNLVSKQVVVPLATTEGALVASVNRGCKAITESGGAKVLTSYHGISRAPVFIAESGLQAQQLVDWFEQNFEQVAQWAAETSKHLSLLSVRGWVRGRYAYVRFVANTDQAMGMNMISIAVQAVWSRLQIKISKGELLELQGVEMVSLSSNLCSDKKASVINGILGRGYEVQAEVVLPTSVIAGVLKTSADALVRTHLAKNSIGSALAGSTAQNMQVANVAAAVFAATGQDLAHVVDVSQATTIIEVYGKNGKSNGGIWISVTIPSMPVGVIGGGSWLPAQSQARKVMEGGLGDGASVSEEMPAWQFASIIGGAILAGEVSGMAALSSNQLACAHQALARVSTEKK